jgi:tetratricopeptide (TPR) repeat protein
MTAKVTRQINAAFEHELWSKARRLLQHELRKAPSDHWLQTRLATTYYEQRKYEKALEASERAVELAAGCPLVRWDYACALDMLDRTDDAIKEWKHLVRIGPNALSKDPCSEGEDWAASLVNDCRYRLALAYADKHDFTRARSYLRNYLRMRRNGVASIYSEAEAKSKLGNWFGPADLPRAPRRPAV